MKKKTNYWSKISIENLPIKKYLILTMLALLFPLISFSQTVYTFTTAGASGIAGPTQSQINTSYASTNLNGSVTVTGGIQSWIVPVTGNYRINASGASGGNSSGNTYVGGFGANMIGEFTLTAGDVIKVLVGQAGITGGGGGSYLGGGGGGGSYITLNSTLLMAAGGGGGAGVGESNLNGFNGNPALSGTSGNTANGTNGRTNGTPGSGGNGGTASAYYGGGGGAGWLSNGGNMTIGMTCLGGLSFSNNGTGGTGGTYGSNAGGNGGFGGGGGGGFGGAGGGGYSGGAAGTHGAAFNATAGGGGGSYNSGTNQTNVAGVNSGNGSVIITNLYSASISQTANVVCSGDLTGALSVAVNGGTAPYSYAWSPNVSSTSTASGLAKGPYSVTVTDGNSLTTTASFTIVPSDNTAPVITTNGDKNVNTSPGLCEATIIVSATATDNCSVGTPTGVRSDAKLLSDAYPLGTTTITWNVTDANGNAAVAVNQTVTVVDNIKPTAISKNITVQLNATGSVTVNADQLDDNSTDNCGINNYKIAPGILGTVCNVVGEQNYLVLTAPAGSTFKNIVFASFGNSTGTCGNFVLGSCNAANSLSVVSSALLGQNSGTIYSSNSTFGDPCNGTQKRLAVEAAYGPSSSSATSSITYSCTDLGSHDVVLYVTDNNGNVSSVNATITVEDTVLPTITCAAIASSYNNDAGVCSYTVSDASLDPVAADNCSVTVSNDFNNSVTLNGATFPLGTTTVIWTATDAAGNTATCTYDIVVVDAEKPTLTCAVPATSYNNDLGVCSFTVVDNSLDPVAADNCSTVSVLNNFNNSATLNGAIFPVGTTNVIWTATDAAGNTETCNHDVVVVDAEAPVALAKDITVQLDATGNVTIVAADVDNGSADLCGAVTLSITPDTFTCANIGDNTVTLTVTDASGNPTTATATVKVEDTTAPIVAVKNITVQLDATGNATIQASDIDDNSTDNCGINTIELDVTSFTCANIGANTVQLKVTDIHGNSDTKDAIVIVEDKIAPAVSTKNITVQLDPTGNATITGNDVDNGSADICNGTLTYSVSPNTFNCTNVGANTVTLTVTDASGNFDTATATVTIEDKTAPIVLTKNITIQFDALGNASIAAADVDNGSITVCGGSLTLAVSPSSFTCANAGANTVTLTATGTNGEISTETAIVTILENVAPIAQAQDITVELDQAGNVSVMANQVNNGSSDNCGIGTITLSKTSFDCTNVGANTVVLTVVDKSGNTATATAKVTVVNKSGDNDNDGILDNCDPDDDNDGVLDPKDNCPITANPYQEDRNNNGIGDTCDKDQMNISEAFTPNGDGINDTWVISNIENHPASVVRVFNRWGAEVFTARNYQNNWDGQAKGQSSTLPAASSYYYQIDLDGNGTIDRQGWIYINR